MLSTISQVEKIDQAINEVSVGWVVSPDAESGHFYFTTCLCRGSHHKRCPVEVVLNEAIELAKEFSSYASPKVC